MVHPYRTIRRMRYGTSFARLHHPRRLSVEQYKIVSQESLRALARRYGINQKTVAKWKERETVADLPTGPKDSQIDRAFHRGGGDHRRFPAAYATAARRLPLCAPADHPASDAIILHRCLQRHGISRLPEVEAASLRRKSSRLIRSGISTSTSPSSRPLKASSTSTSPSIAPASSPSCNWSGRREGPQPRPSSKL